MSKGNTWKVIAISIDTHLYDSLCDQIHFLVSRLPLYDSSFRPRDLPHDGIYFFYEKGEVRHDGNPRIVRIGTHKKQGRLPGRLRDHYRSNRYGSIFRWHLGRALLRLQAANDQDINTWEVKKGLKMPEVEQEVSRWMQANTSFCCLPVPCISDRLALEAWLIATLAVCDTCHPSPHWLGYWSPEETIRLSGLWNVDHLNKYFEPEVSEHYLGKISLLVSNSLVGGNYN